MKHEKAEIVMVESYMETLRLHSKGKTFIYPLPHAKSYNAFHNAKTRFKKKGVEFTFKTIRIENVDWLKVKRLK